MRRKNHNRDRRSISDERLRIAMYGHKRVPGREGGIEVVVEELSTRMTSLGHKVTLFNRRGHHVSGSQFDKKELNEYLGVKLSSVPTIDARGFAAISSSFAAAIRCALGPYDIVHIHAEGPAATCAIPKLFGKRVVVTIHGLDWQRSKWGSIASCFIRFGERQAAKHADEIIVLSKSAYDHFLREYGRKVTIIPNGVSRPKCREANKISEQWGLSKDSYVLFLGRIVPEKGLRYLLKAWREVQTDKRLVIAGGSSDTQDFMEELRNMASERVVFTGFCQGRVLEELYSNAYVYVLPSDLEGMPLSLLEAMSYGCCCLTSNIPECASVVGDAGITFPKGDYDSLRVVLQHLLDNPELVNRYKAEASDYICSKHKWDDVTKRTLALYANTNKEEIICQGLGNSMALS